LGVVPVLLLAYLFLGVYYNFSVWFKLTDKTFYGTIITVAGVFVTIAGNYFLIPVLGYMGSSIATLLCYLLMTVMCYWLGQKHFPIPYTLGTDFLYIAGTTALVYAVNEIIIEDQVAATAFHAMVIVFYLTAIVLIERKGFRQKQA
jgi:O-antigen/teichoic acid export membrane protein